MDLIWIAVIVGTIIGVIVSVLFGVYSKSTADSYIRTIFGVNSTDFIFDGVIFIVILSFIVLTTFSIMIRDLAFPSSSPGNFTIETLLMGFLPASVFLIMPLLRGYKYTSHTALEFFILVLKFGVLHILLQFSGFYSSVFPPLVPVGGKKN